MLTGLISISSGDCYVNGYSVKTDMSAIRESLGVCPQKNVIFPSLTVKEHLEMVAMLKGMSVRDIKKAVDDMISRIGLSSKRNQLAGHLSGGMKRKLCLGMALIADSQVVFLVAPVIISFILLIRTNPRLAWTRIQEELLGTCYAHIRKGTL